MRSTPSLNPTSPSRPPAQMLPLKQFQRSSDCMTTARHRTQALSPTWDRFSTCRDQGPVFYRRPPGCWWRTDRWSPSPRPFPRWTTAGPPLYPPPERRTVWWERQPTFNPFTAPACKISGHIYTHANIIFVGPHVQQIYFSILCVLTEILSVFHVRWEMKKRARVFKFRALIGRF